METRYWHPIKGEEYTKEEWINEYINFMKIHYKKEVSKEDAEKAFETAVANELELIEIDNGKSRSI
ncbi:MAG: hypothetical protein J7K26_02355 [Candidatus Aenigmarchaeota archaeon]|nr:hypothetical protein [Candidatus Aenigmarchaeota archaeon]